MLQAVRHTSFAFVLFLSVAAMLNACSRTQRSDESLIIVEPPTGPGELRVVNGSSHPVTWIWVSPTDADDLSMGAELVLDEPLAPGASIVVEVPGGWWTVWLENEDGADALLHRMWFSSESETALEVTDTYWEMGDFIGEEPDANAPEGL